MNAFISHSSPLSRHFQLKEFAVSAQFPALAEKITFSPTEIERLRFACTAIFEPVRHHFSTPVRITSGKRTRELNSAVGGHPASHHLFTGGHGAADIALQGVPPGDVACWIANNCQVEYVIAYLAKNFVHVSFPVSSPPPKRIIYNTEAP